MKALKAFWNGLHSKAASYIFFALSLFAYVFLDGAKWAYGWIAEIYPLGENFIPTLFGVIIACIVLNLAYLILPAFIKKGGKTTIGKVFRVIHAVSAVVSIIAFVYTMVLVFSFDSGVSLTKLVSGIGNFKSALPFTAVMLLLPLAALFAETPKRAAKALIASAVVAGLVIAPMQLKPKSFDSGSDGLPQMALKSENILNENTASVAFEMLARGEKADAQNILKDNGSCWTPQSPNRAPAENCPDVNNSYVELKFSEPKTFNTAVIEEVGNEVQYFRLQALVDGEWVTVYQSEKIQSLRLCSFDAVTTDTVRLSIDKFRSADTPANIKSLKLYNESKRAASDFEVTAYQRFDGDVPTEILKKGEDYVNNYARYYDVYSTVILFRTIVWGKNGEITFGDLTEEQFAAEVNAFKEIIAHRSNKKHEVKIIVTALSDGLWGDIPGGVNGYMAKYWEKVADQIVDFVEKYDFAGVDIDWEYPANEADWQLFDKFITRLDDGMNKNGENRILSAALSAWGLGMSKETLDRFDQIQFMAYDGCDEDGYQSSLQQAQDGLRDFINNGADISKINIGIAAYGRPVNNTPYWPGWRELETANYWDSKYYNVACSDQIFDSTFCAPALAGDKTAYALFTGVGGVMVFRTGCDKLMDDPNAVARGVENVLNRYVENW